MPASGGILCSSSCLEKPEHGGATSYLPSDDPQGQTFRENQLIYQFLHNWRYKYLPDWYLTVIPSCVLEEIKIITCCEGKCGQEI